MKIITHIPLLVFLQSKILRGFTLAKGGALPLKKDPTLTKASTFIAKDNTIIDTSATPSLQVSQKHHTLTLMLNRPQVLNALDIRLVEALREQLRRAAMDTTIRVVVITGNGTAFCAGGDLKFALEANPDQPGNSFMALTSILHECIEIIRSMKKPVVAAINGPAAGAGLFLTLACDIRIIAQSAYLKVSNTSYGLSLPAGGTFTLPRLIGMGRALEMVMLDQPVDAQTALSLGLVARVVEDNSLIFQADALADELSQKAVNTLGQVKQLINDSYGRSLHEQLLAEQQAIVKSANSTEGREGLAAFVGKRSPVFKKDCT